MFMPGFAYGRDQISIIGKCSFKNKRMPIVIEAVGVVNDSVPKNKQKIKIVRE